MNTDDDIYLKILINEHNLLLNDIINTYYDNILNNQILCYFRIYFLYYILTNYVYKPELNMLQIKGVFFKWLKHTLTNNNKNHILNNFYLHYNYLFKIFFVDKNIYFHVYFNNLVKYFLPLPFELNIYSPIITYRANIDNFYTKSNIDYLLNINNFDLKKKHQTNFNSNDISINIPIKYFSENLFLDFDVCYLVAIQNELFICNSNKKTLYVRDIQIEKNADNYLTMFLNGKSFEDIFPIWKSINKTINFKNADYICVMKKFTNHDLFNVFGKYNITTDKYKYLFHNTQLTNSEIETNEFSLKSKFFYLIPTSKSRYFNKETKRSCVIFKINKDINNLLDLTLSIVSNNDFMKNIINKDRKNKKWISYQPLKTLDFYNKHQIPKMFDENFKCLTTQNSNIKNRNYCDISNYAGRNKLHEILFKTRKYKPKKIYFNLNFDIDYSSFEIYRIYHPLNIPIYETWDFDKYILKMLKSNGFFFVDYTDAIDGGEILLIEPDKYIELKNKSNKPCYIKDAFNNI